MEYEYEKALTDTELTYAQLPKALKMQIGTLKAKVQKNEETPGKFSTENIMVDDLKIADAIQTFAEKDLPDEETLNPNNNTMSKEQEALKARAIACGLPETASEAQIAAKEAENAQKKNIAEANKARAKKVGLAEDATEAEIQAKENELAEKNQKDILAAEAALKVRAKAVGLKETASEAEVTAAENAKKTANAGGDILDELDL